jgi:integrase
MPKGTKHRANGEGSIFLITTPHGPRYKAEATMGYDPAGKRITATGTGATRELAIQRREANRQKLLVLQGKASPDTLRNARPKMMRDTVGVYLDEWFRALNPDVVGESTRYSYRSKIDLHIKPHIGETPLLLLNRKDMQSLFYETLPNKAYDPKNPEKRLSSGAIRNVWKPLYKALNAAVDDGRIPTNPMTGLDKPREERREEKVHTWKPQHLLHKLRDDPDEAKWLVTFLYGVRMSEKLGLTWDCVHLNTTKKLATIEIKQQLKWHLSEHGCGPRNTDGSHRCTKRSAQHCPQRIGTSGLYIHPDTKSTNGRRTLPITPHLRTLLLAHKKRQDIARKSPDWNPLPGLENLVFTKADGKPISQQLENKAWKALCDRFGVELDRGHLSRHTVASMLAHSGVGLETTKLILGHGSEKISQLYTHLNTAKHTKEPLEALENLLLTRNTKSDERKQKELTAATA